MRNILHISTFNSVPPVLNFKLFTCSDVSYTALKLKKDLLKPFIHDIRRKKSHPSINLERPVNEFVGSTLIRVKKSLNKKLKRKLNDEFNNIYVEDNSTAKQYKLDDLSLISNEQFWQNGMKLHIKGIFYEVVVNPPYINNQSIRIWEKGRFKLCPYMSVGFGIREEAFKLSKDLVLMPLWIVTNKENDVEAISFDEYCTLNTSHVGQRLSMFLFPTNKDQSIWGEVNGPFNFSTICSERKIGSLDLRKDWLSQTKPETTVRVMSYNILAHCYTSQKRIRDSLFSHCSFEVIDALKRFPKVLVELSSSNADIICLQELDLRVFDKLFQPALKGLGYKSLHKVKQTGNNVGMEGCSISYKTSMFNELCKEDFCLRDLAKVDENDCETIKQLLNLKVIQYVLLNRTNTIVQYLLLERKLDSKKFLIVNTHLFFHPNADHIRAIQIYFILKHIASVYSKNNAPTVIFSGDFNSNVEAGAMDLIFNGQIPDTHIDCWQNFSSDQNIMFKFSDKYIIKDSKEEIERVPKCISSTHLNLPKFENVLGKVDFTNYVPTFIETLDYILVGSKDKNYKVNKAPLPTREDILNSPEKALPNEVFPSDHISLLVDIDFPKV